MAETLSVVASARDSSRQDLLVTKLYVPPPHPNLVPRPRLVRRLEEGVRPGHRLMLISAPAGFGKSTLLSEWVAGRSRPTAPGPPRPACTWGAGRTGWLSLDEGDNDSVRFLAYFIAALQKIEENLGKGVLSALQSPRPLPMEKLLTALINQISAIPDRFVLVLDDYHLITAQPIHDALAFLLDHLPDNMHLVIATRADPPLPIARLRGRGQMTELRQADLRFTPAEAAQLLNQVMGLDLSVDAIAALNSRTEGWIVGLQLAALSMRGREDLASFIAAFTGSQHYILDYLAEEVLQRQSQSIQAFLLQTSILNRMSGSLCDAVLGVRDQESGNQGIRESGNQEMRGAGNQAQMRPNPPIPLPPDSLLPDSLIPDPLIPPARAADPGQADSLIPDSRFPDSLIPDSQALLDYLEHSNLFIVPLDDRREWYRYHQLFVDFLRASLRQRWPDRVPTLHRRASHWYAQHGQVAEAINHALSAGDFEGATQMVEQAAESTMMRGEFATFLGWIETLPDDMVRARPSLCILAAVALLVSGHPLKLVEANLQEALATDTTGAAAGAMAAFRALVAIFQADERQSAERVRLALELLPEESLFLRTLVAGFLSLNYFLSPDLVTARQALEEAARIGEQAGNLMMTVLAQCHLAELSIMQGRLHEARASYEQTLDLATDERGKRQPIAGMPLMGLGYLFWEWNDLESASHHLGEGIELTRMWAEMATMQGYIPLAYVKQAQGDMRGARQAIERAQQLAQEFDASKLDDIMIAAYQARLWIIQGNIEVAVAWAEAHSRDKDNSLEQWEKEAGSAFLPLHRAFEYIALARVRIAQGRPDVALKMLAPLLQAAETIGCLLFVIEILVLRAMALQRQGDILQALAALERALSLAEPGGFMRMFIDGGQPMAQLLHEAAGRGISPEYTSRLLAAFPDSESRPTASAKPQKPESEMVELLSERELEVLRLLTTHLSSTEIAEELIISANTVRSHIKHIYSKLNAHGRTDAIQRAKELHLL
jgi:LuxR family maltose regulon positive regulatory protein